MNKLFIFALAALCIQASAAPKTGAKKNNARAAARSAGARRSDRAARLPSAKARNASASAPAASDGNLINDELEDEVDQLKSSLSSARRDLQNEIAALRNQLAEYAKASEVNAMNNKVSKMDDGALAPKGFKILSFSAEPPAGWKRCNGNNDRIVPLSSKKGFMELYFARGADGEIFPSIGLNRDAIAAEAIIYCYTPA